MKLENDCRKLVPNLEFQENYANGGQHEQLDLISVYHRDYLLVQCDTEKAKAFSKAFAEPTFEEIVDALAGEVNDFSCGEGVYLLRTVGDKIHLRFWLGEYDVECFRKAVGDPNLEVDESLGYVWVITQEQFLSEGMREHLIGYCETIVDLNTLTVWELKPEHYSIPSQEKENHYLDNPVGFEHADYVAAYDKYIGTDGAFKLTSRGLRLYDPALDEFVKFNRKTSAVKTTAKTLLFRQSYNSYYYLFEVELTTGEIKYRYYESAQTAVLNRFRNRYANTAVQDFQVTGNVKSL